MDIGGGMKVQLYMPNGKKSQQTGLPASVSQAILQAGGTQSQADQVAAQSAANAAAGGATPTGDAATGGTGSSTSGSSTGTNTAKEGVNGTCFCHLPKILFK